MKILLIILFLTSSFSKSYAQFNYDSINWRQKILNEIKAEDQIIDHYLKEGKKVDSLFRHISINEAISYFEDSSYVIKYYSFIRIMELNDSTAFEYLKTYIKDSTEIVHQMSCMNSTEHFNMLIGEDYKRYMKYKYSYTSFTIKGRTYLSEKVNHKKRKKMMKEVDRLFSENGLKPIKVY